jgi:hypothetical protein
MTFALELKASGQLINSHLRDYGDLADASTIESMTQRPQEMSVPSDIELLIESCKQAAIFPRNLIDKLVPQHHLDAYFARLDNQSSRIFCEDGKAAVDIWEYDDNVKG